MSAVAAVFGVADLERVLEIAERLPVFPCGQDKKPLVPRGFHAASQDAAQIRQWWRRWPDALVGVPTGQGTRLVVIDYDPDKATQATHTWMAEHSDLLTSTRVHHTARGGKHYVFRSTDRYQTGVDLVLGGSPRRGIDLRANGGYVIWWPAHLAQPGDEAPVSALPAGLIEERRFEAARDLAALPTATPASWRADRHKVVEALSFLDAEGYEHWIRTGMAIHAASGGSDDGFALWHEWSATGNSYDGIEDCRYHWASFGRYQGRSIGLGSVIKAAQAKGMVIPRSPDQPVPELESDPQFKASEEQSPLVLPYRWSGEIIIRRTAEYAVKGLIPARRLVAVIGSPGAGKSFWTFGAACAIVSGNPFNGHRTGKGAVLWLGLEGEAGIEYRAAAHQQAGLLPNGAPLALVTVPVSLLANAAAITETALAASREVGEPISLVVIDTLSRALAGENENDGEVMTAAVQAADHIVHGTKATCLLVHHYGKNTISGARGHSSLLGALDVQIDLVRNLEDRRAIVKKNRDGQEGREYPFDLQVIDLGQDDEGDPITSCIAVPNMAPPATSLRAQGDNQRVVLRVLKAWCKGKVGEKLPLDSDAFHELMKGAGVTQRQRRFDLAKWLEAGGAITRSVGGFIVHPEVLK